MRWPRDLFPSLLLLRAENDSLRVPAICGSAGRADEHAKLPPLVRRALFLVAVLAALACHRKPPSPPDVIVRVGDRMVSLGDFKRYLDRNAGTDLAQVGP